MDVKDALEKFSSNRITTPSRTGTAFERQDMLVLVRDYVIKPMLSQLINGSGTVYGIETYHGGADYGRYVRAVAVWHEKENRKGFWYNFRAFFCGWQWDVHIDYTGALFTISYYNHRAYLMADEIMEKYNELFRETFNIDIALVDRT